MVLWGKVLEFPAGFTNDLRDKYFIVLEHLELLTRLVHGFGRSGVGDEAPQDGTGADKSEKGIGSTG